MKNVIRLVLIPFLILIIFSTAFGQSDLDKAAKKQALKRCRSLLKETLKEVDAGNYDEALVLLDSVLICDDDNPDGYYHKGRIYYLQGDTTQAVTYLSTGVEKAPRSSRLKLLLARVEIGQGNFEPASVLIDSVLAIKPRESEALYLKGLYHLSQSDTTKAIEFMGKALDYSISGKK